MRPHVCILCHLGGLFARMHKDTKQHVTAGVWASKPPWHMSDPQIWRHNNSRRCWTAWWCDNTTRAVGVKNYAFQAGLNGGGPTPWLSLCNTQQLSMVPLNYLCAAAFQTHCIAGSFCQPGKFGWFPHTTVDPSWSVTGFLSVKCEAQ